jgi:hypothetical protein
MTDEWTHQTKRMIADGYARFYQRRGMKPPAVSKILLMDGDLGLSGAGTSSPGAASPKNRSSGG